MIKRLRDFVADRLRVFDMQPAELLERDAIGGQGEPGLVSANGSCRMLRCNDGWVALNLARPDDLDVIPALTGNEGEPWAEIAQVAARETAPIFRDRAVELQLPVAKVGEAAPSELRNATVHQARLRVMDISALWAGPLCASLLLQMGAEVVRVESTGRPDPTSLSSPRLNARLNGGKTTIFLDLREDAGRAHLLRQVAQADVLVTSARPAALARLGLTPKRYPHLTWVAITAHGFNGDGSGRVGFGDDCAAAGGLVHWVGIEPRFMGDALADPLTGLEAALAVLAGEQGLIDMPMSGVAAAYAKLASQ